MDGPRVSGEETVYAGTLDRPRSGVGRMGVAATPRGGHSPEPSGGEDGGSGGGRAPEFFHTLSTCFKFSVAVLLCA